MAKYFIIAGEASGDIHGASLIRALRQEDADAQFQFLGGDMMAEAAGVRPLIHYRDMAYMGFVEVLKHLPTILGFMATAKKAIMDNRPDAVILIDYPSFNLKIAKFAHDKGIPCLYFISPKVWVWKEYRVKQIKRYIARLFSILPFETAFFRKHDYEVEYVGNPSVKEIDEAAQKFTHFSTFVADNGLDDEKPIIAIVPGSRRKEIRDNLPTMVEAALRHPDYQLVIAGAPSISQHLYDEVLEPLGVQVPVTCDYKRVEMATTPENALVGLGLVLGSALDRKRTIAADILFEALLGSNEAPVKKAILAAGLGGNVVSYTAAESLQPYELIMLQNAQPGVARELRRVFQDACRDLCEHGVPRERLEAIISSNEYDLRQRDYGIADGVAIACDALSTWLYDDDAATLALKYGPVYEELRSELDGSYFEDLLRELVLENDHMALVELVPVDAAEGSEGAEAAELAAKRDAMTDAELTDVVERTAALRAAQEAEDTPEAKATLPRLRVSDIGEARPEPPLIVDTTVPIPCLRHGIPTNRLAYAMQYFDLNCVAFEDLPYVTLLCRLLKQLPTREHSAEELDNLLAGKLGFLSFTTEVMTQPEVDGVRPYLLVSAGALSEKIDALASLPREVWSSTLLLDADADRVRDVLTQIRIGLEQGFINNGHSAALGRAMSYSSPSAVVREQLSGVDFYLFLRNLLEHFDERLDGLRAKLAELAGRIFVADGCMASFTGSDEDFDAYWDAAGDLGLGAGDGADAGRDALVVPTPCDRHEAFIIPSDICFAASACDPRRLDIDVTGTWAVAANALSYDYLWNEIRVKGGAYGCGFRAAGERQTAFYTYRDPAIDPSIERVERAGAWLGSFEPDEAAFEGFIVSCVSGMDAPVKPYALTKRRNTTYLAGLDPHAREERRAQMLAATPGGLRSLGTDVTRIAAASPICVFGGRDVIAKSSAGFNVIDLLG